MDDAVGVGNANTSRAVLHAIGLLFAVRYHSRMQASPPAFSLASGFRPYAYSSSVLRVVAGPTVPYTEWSDAAFGRHVAIASFGRRKQIMERPGVRSSQSLPPE